MIGYEKSGKGLIIWDNKKCIGGVWRHGHSDQWTASNGQNTVKSKTMAEAVKRLKRVNIASEPVIVPLDEVKELLEKK